MLPPVYADAPCNECSSPPSRCHEETAPCSPCSPPAPRPHEYEVVQQVNEETKEVPPCSSNTTTVYQTREVVGGHSPKGGDGPRIPRPMQYYVEERESPVTGTYYVDSGGHDGAVCEGGGLPNTVLGGGGADADVQALRRSVNVYGGKVSEDRPGFFVRDDPYSGFSSGCRDPEHPDVPRPLDLGRRSAALSGGMSAQGRGSVLGRSTAYEASAYGRVSAGGGLGMLGGFGAAGLTAPPRTVTGNVPVMGAARPVLVSFAAEVFIELALIFMALCLWSEL